MTVAVDRVTATDTGATTYATGAANNTVDDADVRNVGEGDNVAANERTVGSLLFAGGAKVKKLSGTAWPGLWCVALVCGGGL